MAAPPDIEPAKKKSRQPDIKNLTRGDKKLGLQIASDPIRLAEAVQKFKKDEFSEGDTTNYYLKTWFDFHDAVD